MFKVQKKDVVLFPFSDEEQSHGGLEAEYSRYANTGLKLDCIGESEQPSKGFRSNLIIVGHGSHEAPHRQVIGGGGKIMRTVAQVAALIAKLEFPKDPAHEIMVWSCHSGGVGGFAQMLALHLTDFGYSRIKVWGCNCYAGVIGPDGSLSGRTTVKGGNAALGIDDLDYWLGV